MGAALGSCWITLWHVFLLNLLFLLSTLASQVLCCTAMPLKGAISVFVFFSFLRPYVKFRPHVGHHKCVFNFIRICPTVLDEVVQFFLPQGNTLECLYPWLHLCFECYSCVIFFWVSLLFTGFVLH